MNDLENQPEKPNFIYIGGAILALIGLALSLYATLHHIDVRAHGATDATCNINQTFNCDDVALSDYAEVFGFPMGIYGIGFFAGMLILLGTSFFKEEFQPDNFKTYAFLAVTGALISIGLFILSLSSIGVICPTCVGVYVTCIAQAGLVIANRSFFPIGIDTKALSNGATYPIAALAVAAIGYSFLKPTPTRNFTPDNPQKENPTVSRDESMLDFTLFNFPISKSAYAGLGEDYRKGSDDAKVVITEFADFECGSCRQISSTLTQLSKDFGDKILITFRNYPLDNKCNKKMSRSFHKWACDAAIIARCAGRHGKFWPMHDKIFQEQANLSGKNLTSWAKEMGLSEEQISACRSSKDILAKIQDDISLGDKAGVTGTPTLYINGRQVIGGRELNKLRNTIQKILGE